MAIDSRIPLMTETPNSFGTMVQALNAGEQLQQMPYRNAMLEAGARMRGAQADAYESSAARQNEMQERERARLRNLFTLNSLQQIRGASPGSRGVLVESLEAQGKSQGLLPPDFDLSEFNFEDDAWLDQNIQIAQSAEEAYKQGTNRATPFQKGASGGMVKDTKGNLFHTSTVFDPSTGRTEPSITPVSPGGPSQPVGGYQPVNSAGLTVDEALQAHSETVRATQAEGRRSDIVGDYWTRLEAANSSINNIGQALEAIERGANTGPVDSWFPSFRAATLELENLGRRMGLDVVAGGNFGPLSEGELKLALETALPTNMEEGDLKVWLVDRQVAQKKLARELQRGIEWFQGGGDEAKFLKVMQMDVPKDVDPNEWGAMSIEDRLLWTQ